MRSHVRPVGSSGVPRSITVVVRTAITTGAVLAVVAAPAAAATSTVTYPSAGEYPIVIPAGVTSLSVVAVGGRGGQGDYFVDGGLGARVTATLPVTPGQTRYLLVGGNGANGTNNAGSGGGGGASDLRTTPASAGVTPTDTRLLVAAGGGGSGGGYAFGANGTSGAGGNAGTAGSNSRNSGFASGGGAAGVPVGTGAGGATGAPDGNGSAGLPGSRGTGGDGALLDPNQPSPGGFNGGGRGGGFSDVYSGKGGGGGGGGLNGGGGGGGVRLGAGDTRNARGGGGGGGGSNLVPAGGTVATDTVGAGSITLSFADSTAPAVTLASGPARVAGSVTVTGTSGTILGDGDVTVEVYAGATATGAPVATKTATRTAATGAYTATVGGLGPGQFTVRATQVDGAMNKGVSSSRTVVSDTTAPALSLVGPSNGLTNDTTPSFSGTAGTAPDDAGTVRVEVRNAQNALVQTVEAEREGGSGAYSGVASPALADGTYTAVAKQSDDVGNTTATSPATFRVDATAPAVALTGRPAARSRDAAPAFTGTAGTGTGDEPTVDVRIFSGTAATGTPAATLAANVGDSGTFTAQAQQLADGTYTAAATQADSAGNRGGAPPTTFTVDTTAPTVTLGTPAAGTPTAPLPAYTGVGGTATGDSPTVTVTVHAGATSDGVLVQTIPAARDAATGAYSATSPFALADGTYTAVSTQADDVGNAGTTQARTFTVDAAGAATGGGTGGGGSPAAGGTGAGGPAAGSPGPGSAGPSVTRDRVAPVLTRVSLTAKRFTVAGARTAVAAKAKARKRGTTVRYTLSEQAKVTLTITSAGRKKAVATLRRQGKRGANRVAFSGRVGNKPLAAGRYTLTLTATDAAGNRAAAKTLRFRIA